MRRLTEAIYDAAVDPGQWAQVMSLMKQGFATGAETFYYLDFNADSVRPFHVDGISPSYLRLFDDRYFTPDNPWIGCEPLHRPGVVRTDERLAAYFRDPQILRRSEYFNDWMRPQDLHHTLGTTLLSEGGIVANLTLLRSEKVGGFRPKEVRAFERACIDLRRAFRVAMRVDALTARGQVTLAALDALPHGILLLDPGGRVQCCNAIGERLLRDGDGLTVRHGRLAAPYPGAQPRLDEFLYHLADPEDAGGGSSWIAVPRRNGKEALTLRGVRLSAGRYTFAVEQPTIMLVISDPAAVLPPPLAALRQRYGLTATEARLAEALVAVGDLKTAAGIAGMTYETARWYLKILFQKTETNRQAALVARLLKDAPALASPPEEPRHRPKARLAARRRR
jgi:DNA-binding CsgD family transcriptional regulator